MEYGNCVPWFEGPYRVIDVSLALVGDSLQIARAGEGFLKESIDVIVGLVKEDVRHEVMCWW